MDIIKKNQIALNKKIVFISLGFAVLINTSLFIYQFLKHQTFLDNGIKTVLYVKSLPKKHFFQNNNADIYYVNQSGTKFKDCIKNTWANHNYELENIKTFLPLDSVIYLKNKPNEYQLVNEFNTYSVAFSAVSYFLVGNIFFTIWIYLVVFKIKSNFPGILKKR